MNREIVKDFQTRIVNAGRGELLIINYEILLAQIGDAVEALQDDNEVEFGRSMVNAHKLLRELSSGLDFQFDISKELMSIYIYVNKKFIDATIHHTVDDLTEASKILSVLLEGWKLTEYKEEAPVMTNAQQIYAGLTYGKNDLNVTVDQNYNRGLKA